MTAPERSELPRILTLTDYYLPGFKGGGALRTLANMVERLGSEFDFRVVTRDRDLGDAAPFHGVSPREWREVGRARVLYAPPRAPLPLLLRGVARDVVYLNSVFSARFGIVPLLAERAAAGATVVLAPRGELSPGALSLKPAKKRAFLAAARALRVHRRVLWQASSAVEADEVRRWFGAEARVRVAPDLVDAAPSPYFAPPAKAPGELRVAFLSRITRKKNLAGAISLLARVRGEVTLTVYGPVEDARYWDECRAAAATLPAGVRMEYAGAVPHDGIAGALRANHLFFLPTLGENFGHVVLEALRAGCPVLLSDRTPWERLEEAGAGWAFPLNAPDAFARVLQGCVEMDGPAFAAASRRAWEHGARCAADDRAVEENRALLLEAAYGAEAPALAGAPFRNRAERRILRILP